MFEVLPENWPAVEIFMTMQTQWKLGAMGGWLGLDYAVLDWVMSLYQVKNQSNAWSFDQLSVFGKSAKEIFFDIRVMEGQSMAILNEVPNG